MLDVEICSSFLSPKLTRVTKWCWNLVIMWAREDVEVHLHTLQTMTEEYQLSSWKSASLFRNNACTWLPNMSTYLISVIQPCRAIIGPTEWSTMMLRSKPSQNQPVFLCWNQAFRIVGFLGCSLNVKSSWCREWSKGRLVWQYHACVSSCLMFTFYGRDGTPSFTHLSIAFSNQRLSNCSPTVDVGFVKLTSDSFCGNRCFQMNIQFCCSSPVLQYFWDFSKKPFSTYDDLFLSMLIFVRCSSSLMLSSHDSCMTPI
jgi:hypothetical protein